jgi:prepilin-type N-terminal cleavage/methylation domain-containing protein
MATFFRSPRNCGGFSLVEVLVSSSLGAIFAALVAQGLGMAATIQAQAQHKTEAAAWVRDDVESLRLQLSTVVFDRQLCTATAPGWAETIANQWATANPDQWPSFSRTSSTGREVRISRQAIANPQGVSAYLLGLQYRVHLAQGGSEIYQFYTELMPAGAAQCPGN